MKTNHINLYQLCIACEGQKASRGNVQKRENFPSQVLHPNSPAT
jgi:hypothetical protein